ncbi:MAG: GlsB/YeaQ/YmgE family stress response membrane protein [Candidatus Izemoplasmataceae bacterium]
MGLLIYIIFGIFVGWIASILMKVRRRGLIKNLIIGLLGAMIGGWIGQILGLGGVNDFTLEGFILATLGAVILIALLRRLRL